MSDIQNLLLTNGHRFPEFFSVEWFLSLVFPGRSRFILFIHIIFVTRKSKIKFYYFVLPCFHWLIGRIHLHVTFSSLLKTHCVVFRVPRGSVVKCLTRNPGVLGSSRTGSSGFFRGSVLGQDTSEPSLVLVKLRNA